MLNLPVALFFCDEGRKADQRLSELSLNLRGDLVSHRQIRRILKCRHIPVPCQCPPFAVAHYLLANGHGTYQELRVESFCKQVHAPVQMRSRNATGRAHLGDRLTLAHPLTRFHQDPVQMHEGR